MATKTLCTQIAEVLSSSADTIAMSKGDVLIRRGHYYAPRNGSEGMATMVQSAVAGKIFTRKGQPVMVAVQDHGIVDKPFRGGASVAQSSHVWVRLSIIAL